MYWFQQIGLPVPVVPTLVVAGALAADGQIPAAGLFFLVRGCLSNRRLRLVFHRADLRDQGCSSFCAEFHWSPTPASVKPRRASSGGESTPWWSRKFIPGLAAHRAAPWPGRHADRFGGDSSRWSVGGRSAVGRQCHGGGEALFRGADCRDVCATSAKIGGRLRRSSWEPPWRCTSDSSGGNAVRFFKSPAHGAHQCLQNSTGLLQGGRAETNHRRRALAHGPRPRAAPGYRVRCTSPP